MIKRLSECPDSIQDEVRATASELADRHEVVQSVKVTNGFEWSISRFAPNDPEWVFQLHRVV